MLVDNWSFLKSFSFLAAINNREIKDLSDYTDRIMVTNKHPKLPWDKIRKPKEDRKSLDLFEN